MSSDRSFTKTPDQDEADAPSAEPSPGGQVLGFPSEEVSTPGQPVPAGVWNTPADADESTERPLRRTRREDENTGRVVAFPRQPITQKRRRSDAPPRGDDTGRLRTALAVDAPAVSAAEIERPKYLASELLKTDWFPKRPLVRTARFGAVAVGVLGVIAMTVLGGAATSSLLLAGVFLACAAVGLAPVTPKLRAIALAALGVVGVGAVAALSGAYGDDPAMPLLAVCATLTTGGLLFRAAHRTSKGARSIVAVGLVALVLWLVLTGGIEALIVEHAAWQAWVSPSVRLLLIFVVLGGMLSFLDPQGHGGAWIAGASVLGWLVVYASGSLVLALWPLRGPGAALGAPDMLAIAALPLAASIAAVGMCQALALLLRPRKPRQEISRGTIG
jgi:hypothetical protein